MFNRPLELQLVSCLQSGLVTCGASPFHGPDVADANDLGDKLKEGDLVDGFLESAILLNGADVGNPQEAEEPGEGAGVFFVDTFELEAV